MMPHYFFFQDTTLQISIEAALANILRYRKRTEQFYILYETTLSDNVPQTSGPHNHLPGGSSGR